MRDSTLITGPVGSHLVVSYGRAVDAVRRNVGTSGRPSGAGEVLRVLRQVAGIDVGVRVKVPLGGGGMLRIVDVRRRSKIGRHELGTEDGSVKANFLSIVSQVEVAGRKGVHKAAVRRK